MEVYWLCLMTIKPLVSFTRKKNGECVSLVCHESLFVNSPDDTWWIGSHSTIHIVDTMLGFLDQRKPNQNEDLF